MKLRLRAETARGLAIVLVLATGLPGCLLNGNPRVFRVDEDDNGLYAPRKADWLNPTDVVHRRATDAVSPEREDTFAIMLNEAFFKYLPDVFGVNEAVLVFEFTEEGRDGQEESITKVIGPLHRVADGGYSSTIGTYLYGPKYMQGDALRVHISVIEVDADERDDSTAILDFVGDAAAQLSDPVTAAEIAFAKEVAKTLVDLNQNDMVMECDVTFVPYDEQTWNFYEDESGRGNGTFIPLRTGTWGVIKQEAEHVTRSYFSMTRSIPWGEVSFWSWRTAANALTSIGTVLADLAFTPLVLLNRTFGDYPDGASLAAIEPDGSGRLYDDGYSIALHPESKWIVWDGGVKEDGGSSTDNADVIYALYESKSWLTFEIVRGGDPTTWEFRKALAPLEEEVENMLKRSTVAETLNSHRSAVLEAAMAFEKTVAEIEAAKTRTVFSLRVPTEPYLFATGAALPIEVVHPKNQRFAISVVPGDENQAPFNEVPTSTPDTSTFTLGTANAPTAGTYAIQFHYASDSGKAISEGLDFTVVPAWTPANVTAVPDIMSGTAWLQGTDLVITGVDDYLELIDSVTVFYTAPSVGARHFQADDGLTIDIDAGRVSLASPGFDIGTATRIEFHMKHDLPTVTVP